MVPLLLYLNISRTILTILNVDLEQENVFSECSENYVADYVADWEQLLAHSDLGAFKKFEKKYVSVDILF